MKIITVVLRVFSGAALPLGAASAMAAVPAPAPAATKQEAVVLSAFEVRTDRDVGYTATQSMSGSRLASELRETPASISVLNREFLNDLGARSVQEAVSWAANTTVDTADEPGPGGNGGIGSPSAAAGNNNVRTRGGRTVTVTRNFFRWSVDSDLYNTERVDLSRGPNALLFGDAAAAGVLNVSPARAQFGLARSSASIQLSSFGGPGRFTFDLNRPVGEKVALRLMGVAQDQDSWREFGYNKRRGLYLTGLWSPWRSTEIQADAEWGKGERLLPQVNMREFMTGWNFSTTVAVPNLAAATLAQSGLERMPAGLVFIPSRPNDGIYTWNPLARTLGSNASNSAANAAVIAKDIPFGYGRPAAWLLDGSPAVANGTRVFPVVPRYDFATRLGASRVDSDFRTASVFVRHTFSFGLNWELAGNVQQENRVWRNRGGQVNNVRIDVNSILPPGYTINGSSSNPNFLKPFVEDQPLATVDFIRAIEARSAFVYRFDRPWVRQTLGAIVSGRRLDNSQRRFGLVRTNGANPNLGNAANTITERAYLDRRDVYTFYELGWDYQLGDTRAAMATAGANATNSNDNEAWLTSFQLFANGSWFDARRLHTVLGLRRDHYEADGYATPVLDPVTSALRRINKSTHTDLVRTSPSLGAVVDVLPAVSVYFNRSKSFLPPSSATDFRINFRRTQNPIRTSNGSDYGVRFRFLGDRVSGSVGYYTLEERNATFGASSTITDSLRAIGAALGVSGLDFGTGGATTDTSDTKTRGYEWDITANLSRRWALLLSGGIPAENTTVNVYPALQQVLAANRATWVATGDPTVAGNLALIDAEIAAQANSSRNFPRYRANALARYTVAEGAAKGLSVGGGIQVFGPVRFEQVPFPRMEVAGYQVASAFARYQFRRGKINWSLQLNVSNLLDAENFRWTRYQATAPAARPANFRIDAPREFSFTLRTAF